MRRRSIVVEAFADLLNRLTRKDPAAMRLIVEHRVPVSDDFATPHEPCVVIGPSDGRWQLGVLGIINGLLAPTGYEIQAMYTDDAQDRLLGFRAMPKIPVRVAPPFVDGWPTPANQGESLGSLFTILDANPLRADRIVALAGDIREISPAAVEGLTGVVEVMDGVVREVFPQLPAHADAPPPSLPWCSDDPRHHIGKRARIIIAHPGPSKGFVVTGASVDCKEGWSILFDKDIPGGTGGRLPGLVSDSDGGPLYDPHLALLHLRRWLQDAQLRMHELGYSAGFPLQLDAVYIKRQNHDRRQSSGRGLQTVTQSDVGDLSGLFPERQA